MQDFDVRRYSLVLFDLRQPPVTAQRQYATRPPESWVSRLSSRISRKKENDGANEIRQGSLDEV